MKIQLRFLFRVAGGLGAATLLSLVVSGVTFWSTARTLETYRLVQEELEIIRHLDNLLIQVKDAEKAQRDYVLTGEKMYQESYTDTTLKIDQEIKSLRQLTTHKIDQQHRLDTLESLITQYLAQLQEVIRLRLQQGLATAILKIKRNNSNVVTDQMSRVFRDIEAQEKSILLQRQQIAGIYAQDALLTFFVGILLNFLIFCWIYRLTYNEILQRTRVEKEIKFLNVDLEHRVTERTKQVEKALEDLQKTQSQLIQTEKISSLGQLVAGIAHEINNPVNFIFGNLNCVHEYSEELLKLLHLYQNHYPSPHIEISEQAQAIDLEFIAEDLPKTLSSMKIGTERIKQIVLSLRNFSRLDEAEVKPVDIHEGIDNTLLILQHRIKANSINPGIQLLKEYGKLPLVECHAGLLNQVFMNILSNALDALEEKNHQKTYQEWLQNPGKIRITTQLYESDCVRICISDNGPGISEEVQQRLFDPFFTTKPVGKGTGMGMSISYQIVTEKHHGKIWCVSKLGQGAEFWIEIPLRSASNIF